jgi:hypothetical protein
MELVQGLEEVGDALSADPVIAAEDGAQGLGEVAGDGVLEDDAAGADLQGLNDLLGGDGAGEHDDLDARRLGHDGTHGFEAGEARHGEVEQKNVGFELEGLGDGVVAVFGFADDFEAGFVLQYGLDTGADDEVVVGDDDADVGDGGNGRGGFLSGLVRCCFFNRHCLPRTAQFGNNPLRRVMQGYAQGGRTHRPTYLKS